MLVGTAGSAAADRFYVPIALAIQLTVPVAAGASVSPTSAVS
jgi:hypothetical protein